MKWPCILMPVVVLAGCASRVPDRGVPVREAFEGPADGFHLSIRPESSPLAAPRFVPVYQPAEILPVYVPTRISKERDIVVGEHWIFMKLNNGSWFSERGVSLPEPEEAGTSEDLEFILRRLRSTRFEEAVEE